MNRIQSIAASMLVLAAVPSSAADPAVRCESGKLKATAKYSSCRLKAHATAVSKNLTPDFSKCDEKYAPAIDKLEDVAGGLCPSEDDSASLQARVTDDATDLATLIGGGSLATCGDNVAEEDEPCDGTDLTGASCVSLGFASGTLACTAACQYELSGCNNSCETCGNGVVDAGEECDWDALNGETCYGRGYLAGGDLDCTQGNCTFDESGCLPGKLVFVTAGAISGDFGGISAADAFCMAQAATASLSGTFKAWISAGGTSPFSSFTESPNPYVRTDGVIIANNWEDLTDGVLDAPLIADQHGAFAFSEVWTGTSSSGVGSGANCVDWTSTAASGVLGSSIDSFSWSSSNTGVCTGQYRLYCFEQ